MCEKKMDSYGYRSVLEISVLIPFSSREILSNAIDDLRRYEEKFEKLRRIKQEKEIARDKDDRCDNMAAGYQLVRDAEIDLIDMILDEEF